MNDRRKEGRKEGRKCVCSMIVLFGMHVTRGINVLSEET